MNAPLSSHLVNISGELRDQDVFVLGDDDENDDGGTDFHPMEFPISNTTVDGLTQAKEKDEKDVFKLTQADSTSPQDSEEVTSMLTKYYLNRSDTLQGLSLRLGIDVSPNSTHLRFHLLLPNPQMHEIRKLNNLPPNIIRNPSLLHTRAFLILPPSAKPHPSPITSKKTNDKGREAELVRQRAVKRLQTLTKEVDWRIAQAYVALADDEHEQEARVSKIKEFPGSLDAAQTSSFDSETAISGTRLECLAVERYLDDIEWEAEEIKAGRQPVLPKFPFGDFKSQVKKDLRLAGPSR